MLLCQVAIDRPYIDGSGNCGVAHVPVRGGEVVEEGDFVLDGGTFRRRPARP